MKKLISIIVSLLLCSMIVSAEEGDVEVYSFKVYADGERQDSDWDDVTIEINPGQTLEIQMRLENNHNQSDIDIDVVGILYDVGDDLKRDKSFEIDEDAKKSLVLEYYIPSDLNEGLYDLNIYYEYEALNPAGENTAYKHERTFEIEVTKYKVDQNEVLLNLTRELAAERHENNELLSTVLSTHNLSVSWAQCKSDLASATLNEEFKGKYETELNKSRKSEVGLATCETQKGNMYSQTQLSDEIKDAERAAKREQKSSDDTRLMMAGVGVFIYFQWKKKKDIVGGKGEGFSLKGAKW